MKPAPGIAKIITTALIFFSAALPLRGEEREYFTPVSRRHTRGETLLDVTFLYGVHWAGYFVLFKFLSDWGGSIEQYKENIFPKKIQWWDGDSFWWNFVGHPDVGSQTYLYYRARGYGKKESFIGSFTASFLFESTIEVMQEPFSFNDAVVTPAFGYVLGNFLEKISLEMINSNSTPKKILARMINPSMNFKFYEGVRLVPVVSRNLTGIFLSCYFD